MNIINGLFYVHYGLLSPTFAVEQTGVTKFHAHRNAVLTTRNLCIYAVFSEIDGCNKVISRVLHVPYEQKSRRA